MKLIKNNPFFDRLRLEIEKKELKGLKGFKVYVDNIRLKNGIVLYELIKQQDFFTKPEIITKTYKKNVLELLE